MKSSARSAAIQVGTWTPLVTEATGRSASGTPGHIGAHIERVTCPCSSLTAFTLPAERSAERGHVELLAAAVVVRAERQESLAVGPERAPAAGQVRLDQIERKRVVAGGHRCVRREHGGFADFLERRFEARAVLDEVADALQHDESGVSFVQMEHARLDAERLQHANAADAENDFLLDARFAITAVQTRGQLAVPRGVFLEIGVEQIQRDAAEPDPPHRDEHACARRAARR